MTPDRWEAMQTAANRQDDRLAALVADALTAIAEEAQR